MLIEELTAIIGMQFLDGEGQALQDMCKAPFHGALSTSEHGGALAPASSHINKLDGMAMQPPCIFAAVIDQVHLEVARLGQVPGKAPHRHPFGGGIGSAVPFPCSSSPPRQHPGA